MSRALYLRYNRLIKKTSVLKTQDRSYTSAMPPGEMPLRSTYSFRYALPLLQAEIPSASTWLARLSAIMSAAGVMPAATIMSAAVIMPAAASGSSALISPFTPDLPAAIPPPAALFEVNARVTTLNHRFVFLKLFLVVLYFSRKKMSRAS